MSKTLDSTDRKILAVLQREGRITNAELAKRINLSPTPCLERVRRLEREDYILGYRAELNPELLDAATVMYVEVTLDRTTQDVFEQFATAVARLPQVISCHMVAGGFDYLLKIRTKDMAAFRRFLGEKLTDLPGVMQTHTYVVMEEVKKNGDLPTGVPVPPPFT